MSASAVAVEGFDAQSVLLAAELLAEFMAPPPVLTVTQWAEQHRRLAGTESAEPGPYRVSRTPYAREPQDCMSARSTVEEVVLMWAAQTSKTTVLLNCLGSAIGTNPGPIMIVLPTNTVAKRNSRQRIAIDPIHDADTRVYFDYAAKRQDKSDARRVTVITEMDPDEYEERYDDSISSWPTPEPGSAFNWATPDVVWC